ncbi:hypothetical protein CFOL_v3_35626, partial [Cephalotus follicularis]
LKAFNLAMLVKQGWRLITHEDSLCSMVLKARYFKYGTFSEVSMGHNPSFTWRSVHKAKEVLKRGLKWKVGNKLSIDVWSKGWIPNVEDCPTPNTANTLGNEA